MVIQVLLLFWRTIAVFHFHPISSHHQTESSFTLKLMNLQKKQDLNWNTRPLAVSLLNYMQDFVYVER
jgi:hypothetical protein